MIKETIGTREIYGGWEAYYIQEGFETCDWPEAIGKTEEEAIANLKKKYD